jgi:hypothetical protein
MVEGSKENLSVIKEQKEDKNELLENLNKNNRINLIKKKNKVHKCEEKDCGKSFKEKTNLIAHQRVHVNLIYLN